MKNFFLILGFTVAVLGLAEAYSFAAKLFNVYWFGAAIVNSLIASAYVVFSARKKSHILVLFFAVAVASAGTVACSQVGLLKPWAAVLWIPVVEEFAFRGFFRSVFLQNFGKFWGVYASILFFTLAHSEMTVHNILALNFSFFLGPFLLAVICEILVAKYRTFTPAIIFHALCNLTPTVFLAIDPRWLNWLNWLYMKSS